MTFAESLRHNRAYLAGTVFFMAAAYYRVVPDMVRQWYTDPNYSHAFFVPLISGYFLYTRREQLRAARVSPWNPGLAVVVLGVVLLVLGSLATEYFTMRSSLVVALAGIILFLFGREVFGIALAPVAYLMLMVPLPYIIYDAVAFPLKLFVTRSAVGIMRLVGITVLRQGNIIMLPTITLEVADACSGMRSLYSLTALAVAYALYKRTNGIGRLVIIASAVPIAILSNIARVVITGALAQRWPAAAEGFFHELAGLTVFAAAFVMLAGVGFLVKVEDGR